MPLTDFEMAEFAGDVIPVHPIVYALVFPLHVLHEAHSFWENCQGEAEHFDDGIEVEGVGGVQQLDRFTVSFACQLSKFYTVLESGLTFFDMSSKEGVVRIDPIDPKHLSASTPWADRLSTAPFHRLDIRIYLLAQTCIVNEPWVDISP